MHTQGLVEAVGVSNYGPKQMQKIHRYCMPPVPCMTHCHWHPDCSDGSDAAPLRSFT